MALFSLLCAAQLVLPQSCSSEMFCSAATEVVLTLLLFFVFPAGEGEAAVQTVLHTGRPAQHRGWRSGSVSPSRAVGESMTLGHCQRLWQDQERIPQDWNECDVGRDTHAIHWWCSALFTCPDHSACSFSPECFTPRRRGPGTFMPSMNWTAASAGCFSLGLWVNLVLSSTLLNLKLLYFEGRPVNRRGFSWRVPVLLSRDTYRLVG